jgi:hypothetical protein
MITTASECADVVRRPSSVDYRRQRVYHFLQKKCEARLLSLERQLLRWVRLAKRD